MHFYDTNDQDWQRWISLTQKQALTHPGAQQIESLLDISQWAQTPKQATLRQDETLEVLNLLNSKLEEHINDSLWRVLRNLDAINPSLNLLEKDGVIGLEETIKIRQWMIAIETWRTLFQTKNSKKTLAFPLLNKSFSEVYNFSIILEELNHILTPENTLSENASTLLKQLFLKLKKQKNDLAEQLLNIQQKLYSEEVLQENFFDVREGRYVLPVKASTQSLVKGTIYGSSVSKQTVFIEPEQISPLNNELKKIENDIQVEIFRIFSTLSKKLKNHLKDLTHATNVLIHWDSVGCRAKMALRTQGQRLHISENGNIFLHNTAHPLLWFSLEDPKQVVKNSLYLPQEKNVLLLTGPNTGGKTVLLKTLGMAAVFVKTGFFLPGDQPHEVRFFSQIFSDLGDPQSIEAQVSSFSGHILHIKLILEKITQDSLILLDELNSSTDPEEGSALSRALLETFIEKKALTIATTHDPKLKLISMHDPRVLCASLEFESEKKIPTYTLKLGSLGGSKALETAERLGLPKTILERAKFYLENNTQKAQELIEQLEQLTLQNQLELKKLTQLREEAESLKSRWKEKMRSSIEDLLQTARIELQKTVLKLKKQPQKPELQSNALNEVIQNALPTEVIETLNENTHSPSYSHAWKEGDFVIVKKWKSQGQIVECLPEQKYKIALGSLHFILSKDDLMPSKKTSSSKNVTLKIPEKNTPISSLLDLRGERYEEAMTKIEKTLDHVFREKLFSQITIIHGLGTGALREGTRQLLKQIPYVKTFRDASPSNGGAGATEVEFDFN